MVHAGCFCSQHSLILDMNVRIFWVNAMECICAQTRPRFLLSSKRVLWNGVRTHVNSKGKISCIRSSEEDRTHDAASCRTASPTHYRLSYSGPMIIPLTMLKVSKYDSQCACLCFYTVIPSGVSIVVMPWYKQYRVSTTWMPASLHL